MDYTIYFLILSAIGGFASIYALFYNWYKNNVQNVIRNTEKLAVISKNIENITNDIEEIKKSIGVLNHNSDVVVSYLVKAGIMPPEQLKD